MISINCYFYSPQDILSIITVFIKHVFESQSFIAYDCYASYNIGSIGPSFQSYMTIYVSLLSGAHISYSHTFILLWREPIIF